MSAGSTDFAKLEPGLKERLTLRLMPEVKEELKRQAKRLGFTPSAYVAAMVEERRRERE